MNRGLRALFVLLVALVVVQVVFPEMAFAANTEDGLPYEKWLDTFKKSVTGPVAVALILIGMVGAGAMLVWGGEIGTFLKSVIYLTLVACLIIGASKMLTGYFNTDDVSYSLQNEIVSVDSGRGGGE